MREDILKVLEMPGNKIYLKLDPKRKRFEASEFILGGCSRDCIYNYKSSLKHWYLNLSDTAQDIFERVYDYVKKPNNDIFIGVNFIKIDNKYSLEELDGIEEIIEKPITLQCDNPKSASTFSTNIINIYSIEQKSITIIIDELGVAILEKMIYNNRKI